jgi:F-type H+-transporting ATPase subunit b
MEALGINLGYLFVQIFNFLIVLVVLRAWVYKPVVGLLQKRRETIAQGLEDARVAAEARANAEKEAESVVAAAQQEANNIVREATDRAEQAAAEVKAEAEKEAEDARQSSLAEGEQLKNQALGELRGQVAALAVAAAQKVINEALDQKRQEKLIDEFFSGIEAGKVVVLEGEELEGQSATVTSALPLSPDETQRIEKSLMDQLGSEAEIEFRVNPSILGGLVVRVGDKIVDGSVSGKLAALEQSLS